MVGTHSRASAVASPDKFRIARSASRVRRCSHRFPDRVERIRRGAYARGNFVLSASL